MFDNKTVFIIVRENKTDKIYKLETDNETQREINNVFDASAAELTEKQRIAFTGSYTPLEDEVLYIQNFNLSDELKDAFRDPVSVESFNPGLSENQDIRAICIGYCENTDSGEKFTAAFQRFRRDQYISVGKIRLLFDNTTFTRDRRAGIIISENIDCVFQENSLIFLSYYYARQVFNLAGYYRTASDGDVDHFIASPVFNFNGNETAFKESANSWVRRKIALINDSGVLTRFSASEIKGLAHNSGIDIAVEDQKIVFPAEKEDMKVLLSFLDEEAYQGPFSKDTFVSTSKRRVVKA